MEQVANISLENIIARETHAPSFGNEVMVVELFDPEQQGEKDMPEPPPTRIDAFSVMLICNGSADININDVDYHLSGSSLLDLTHLHLFRNLKVSSDFRAYHVLVSMPFYDEMFHDNKPLTPAGFSFKRVNPIEEITKEEAFLLEESISRLIRNIRNENHVWHRRIIMNAVKAFFLELGNIIIQNMGKKQKPLSHSDNDLLFFRFINLLEEYCKEKRTVAFYAEKLCLTPEHLTKAIKNLSGKTVNEWISEILLMQAKACLRDPEITLQQIADRLNFSDQSAFGKFFKKQAGVSPAEYRRGI